MPCYHPVSARVNERSGAVKLSPPLGEGTLALPCGRCLGCRSRAATIWAKRCEHEASLYRDNVFVSLTYTDEFVPADGNLVPRALQLFFKRLRAQFAQRIRFFACGEYGETTGRPHYHALLFNCAFADQVRVGADLFESALLSSLWPYGGHRIGKVTGASANYVARYSLKPMGFRAGDADGVPRVKPFLRMSRMPGIGAGWLACYGPDLRDGFLVSGGRRHAVPRAYRRMLEVQYPGVLPDLEDALAGARVSVSEERLRDGEVIHQQHFERSQRSL